MRFLDGVWHGFDEAFFMFWATLWALVLGFTLSGAVQAFVSRDQMRRTLGDHRARTLGKASFFGVVSSSCSYASAALAKSLFARGADFTAAMVFMVASTNLVVELGAVLWLLIGWQFALAEFVGGVIMIALLAVALPLVVPATWADRARTRLDADSSRVDIVEPDGHGRPEDRWRSRISSRAGWSDAAGYTLSDLTMLRKELGIGFVVAGFLAALVPTGVWRSLFWTGHGFASSLENVLLGPLLAMISFVCSVGNVPLAAALWQGGASFGGVVSFVFADLITLPLLAIYRKYFGAAITARLLVVFWGSMSAAGLGVETVFRAVGVHAPGRPRLIARQGFRLDHTTVLNIAALAALAVLWWLQSHRDQESGRYATDPVCGMQVERAHAPATAVTGGERFWFCSDHCRHRFAASGRVRATGGPSA